MSRLDRLALALSLSAILVSYGVAVRIFERMGHLEDELAYIWQAEVIAGGHLTRPIPPGENSFLVPFVVDYQGQRFGKYPLGWPVVLALGVLTGARGGVNPLLAGLGVWLTYRLGKRIFAPIVGVIAAGLTLTSPFFLMNSGSLLSHPLGLVLTGAFTLAWLEAFTAPRHPRPWLAALTAGAALGLLALTRPFTALVVALPFGLHGLVLLWRGPGTARRQVLTVGLLAAAIGGLHLLWQWAVTGDPMLNPYVLWWPYDRIGFGPGIGHRPDGHNLQQAWINTRYAMRTGMSDLMGWGPLSLLFVPFGLWAARKNLPALTVGSLMPLLAVGYLAYWVGASLFGPRYYYEGLFSLTIFSAAGIVWLVGDPQGRAGRVRLFAVLTVVMLLVTANLRYYLPPRLAAMQNLYGISRADLRPFAEPEALRHTPALVVVRARRWMEYGALLELSDPYFRSPFIFIFSRGPVVDDQVIAAFPDRTPLYYYPDRSQQLYRAPQPDPPTP
jgi:hypothetical protein